MTIDNRTLGELLSVPAVRAVAKEAIRNRDLSREELWHKTPAQLREERIFAGDTGRGLQRLYEAAETEDWIHFLYSGEEIAEDAAREGVSVVRFASGLPEADERPFILVVPGGGFVNVWNLTEGWPIAERFNRLGYHAFILTYQVDGRERLLEKNMEDFSRALRYIRDNEKRFHVRGDRYITCGFSAGGYLICLWNTGKGYPAFGLPGPRACFPVYPFVSLKKSIRDWKNDPENDPENETEDETDEDIRLYGVSAEEAAETEYEIPEHAEGFPPTAVFHTAEDELVDPEHSRILARALEGLGIPCRLEIGPTGGHGFADGTGMCMDGWPERAVRWYENEERAGN